MNKSLINEKGIALILILWVVILLGVIVNTFAWMTRTEAQAVGNFKDETRAYYLARAGFNQTIAELLKIQGTTHKPVEEGLKLDGRINMLQFTDGYADVSVMDEGGKIDINAATRDDIIRVLSTMELDMGNKDEIADSILDWIDENNFHRLNGAEDDYYRLLPEPYGAKDAPFSTVDELLWVRGVTPKIFYNQGASQNSRKESISKEEGENQQREDRDFRTGMESFFTVFTGSNKININTAPEQLLLSLPGIGVTQVERIIAIREESPFRDLSELMKIVIFPPENGKFISFSPSGVYTIEAAGRLNGSNVRRSFKSVVKIKGKTDYEILYWKEG